MRGGVGAWVQAEEDRQRNEAVVVPSEEEVEEAEDEAARRVAEGVARRRGRASVAERWPAEPRT